MIVDAFGHIMPEPVYEEMSSVNPSQTIETHDQPHFRDIDNRLDDMDDFGIDKQVLTLASADSWLGMSTEDALPVARLANDEIRRIADEHPDRFIPVATLPFLDDDFMAEFDRCIDDLGMAGIQIFTNVRGRPLDSEEFRPVFEKAEDKGVPIWLHPQLSDYATTGGSIFYGRLFGWLFDTTMAVARLVFSGIVERHPGLDLITHHTGGMIPHFSDRIDETYQIREFLMYDLHELSGSVDENFRSFYGDTVVSGSASALDCGYDFFGADQLVFATDYPYGQERGRQCFRQEIEAMEGIDVDDDERERIYGRNVLSLVDG